MIPLNKAQQKLVDDARLLHRFLKQNRSGSTLSLTIQRFMDQPGESTELSLRKDIKQELDFLKSLTPTYSLHSQWLDHQRRSA